MTRLIDADALAKFIDYGHLNNPNEKLYSENDIREMIDMMPTIDAVPVIRCDACRFWEPYPNQTVDTDMHKCRKWSVTTHIRGYCYKGEKKDA